MGGTLDASDGGSNAKNSQRLQTDRSKRQPQELVANTFEAVRGGGTSRRVPSNHSANRLAVQG